MPRGRQSLRCFPNKLPAHKDKPRRAVHRDPSEALGAPDLSGRPAVGGWEGGRGWAGQPAPRPPPPRLPRPVRGEQGRRRLLRFLLSPCSGRRRGGGAARAEGEPLPSATASSLHSRAAEAAAGCAANSRKGRHRLPRGPPQPPRPGRHPGDPLARARLFRPRPRSSGEEAQGDVA